MSVCNASGCSNSARRQYCSERCRERAKKQRFRIEEISITATIAFTPQAFGVPCAAEVAFIFADDAERFRAMQVIERKAS